jgi:hypothetical protein
MSIPSAFLTAPSVDDAVKLMAPGAVVVTGSVVTKSFSMTSRTGHVVDVIELYERIPEGSFCCTRCRRSCPLGILRDGEVSRAYALREMDDGGDTITFGGLICGDCVETCGREIGGGPGQVRCACLSETLYAPYDGPSILVTSFKELVERFQCYYSQSMQDGNLPSVLYQRYLARKVRIAMQDLVRRRRQRMPLAIPKIVSVLRGKQDD